MGSRPRPSSHTYTSSGCTISPLSCTQIVAGVLWITVGAESGFEGLTGIYFYEIIVTLRSQ